MDIVERLKARCHDSPMHAEHMMDEAAAEIERLRAELLEQARIIGMSGERELALRAKVEKLRKAANMGRERLADMLDADDGQAWLEASKALIQINAILTETNHD